METTESTKKITIIAEAGINHNGNIHDAISLAGAAKNAGADAVKFQLFTKRARPKGGRYIFQKENWQRLLDAIENKIRVFWSVFDFESVDLAKELGATWVKLSLVERRNLQLIERCEKAGFERKIMSVDLWGQYPKRPGWEYLYCPNNGWSGYYPTEFEHIEWQRYAQIAKETGMGWSCHCEGFYESVIAATFGAKIIEKHFQLPGSCPDAKVSVEPRQFRLMVDMIRQAEQ